MNSPLDRLRNARQQANSADETRELYAKFIAAMREQGWTEADVSEYAESIRVLMGKDDHAALSLFPAGLYETADQARSAAIQTWKNLS